MLVHDMGERLSSTGWSWDSECLEFFQQYKSKDGENFLASIRWEYGCDNEWFIEIISMDDLRCADYAEYEPSLEKAELLALGWIQMNLL